MINNKNKKGAELTIGTLVIIVLAVIVLVVIALGFGAGWSNLWSKITGYFSPVNVDTVKQACNYACTTKSSYDYCTMPRNVVVMGEDSKKDYSNKDKTCKMLEAETKWGFEECTEVECTSCVGLGGTWTESGDCPSSIGEIITEKVADLSDKPLDKDGKTFVCCKKKAG